MSMSIRSTGSPSAYLEFQFYAVDLYLSTRPPRSSESGFSNQMREHDRYGGNSPDYKAVTQAGTGRGSAWRVGGGVRPLDGADAGGLLSRADLALLGEVAYATGHLNVTIEAWERALCGVRAGGPRGRRGEAQRFALLCTCFSTPR